MRRLAAAALLALSAACAPEKAREFEVGLLGPAGPGVASAARAAGLAIREEAPEGADEASAAAGASLADWSALRLHVARAAVRGRTGVFFVLPPSPAGKELTDFPEEWQALARVGREAAALRPILESGFPSVPPFPVPEGAEARAWRWQGRLYVLLVNDSGAEVRVSEESLRPWRALFEVRADARALLVPCGDGLCLPAARAVWLEGRL